MQPWRFLAILGLSVTAAADPGSRGLFQSDFTELVGPSCVVAPGGDGSAECPGLMGYRINLDREDGRVFLRIEKGGYTSVVPEEGALRFVSKLEWRRKGAMPLAVIVRAFVAAKDGAEREVVLLQGLDGNGKIRGTFEVKKGKDAEGQARAKADRGRATPR